MTEVLFVALQLGEHLFPGGIRIVSPPRVGDLGVGIPNESERLELRSARSEQLSPTVE